MPKWVVVPVPEEKQLVLSYRPADLAAGVALIETGLVKRNACRRLTFFRLINRIQFAILKVLINGAVNFIGSALKHNIE